MPSYNDQIAQFRIEYLSNPSIDDYTKTISVAWSQSQVDFFGEGILREGDLVDGRIVVRQPFLNPTQSGERWEVTQGMSNGTTDMFSHFTQGVNGSLGFHEVALDYALSSQHLQNTGVNGYFFSQSPATLVSFTDGHGNGIGTSPGNLGNSVTLKFDQQALIGGEWHDVYVTYSHARSNSITLALETYFEDSSNWIGSHIPAGTLLGIVGNSGYSENIHLDVGYSTTVYSALGHQVVENSDAFYGNPGPRDEYGVSIPPVYILGFDVSLKGMPRGNFDESGRPEVLTTLDGHIPTEPIYGQGGGGEASAAEDFDLINAIDQADLTFDEHFLRDNTLTFGQSVQVEYDVANIGTVDSGRSDVSLYLSRGRTFEEDRDLFITNDFFGSNRNGVQTGVEAGDADGESETITITADMVEQLEGDLSPTNLYLLYVIDAGRDIPDADRSNNVAYSRFSIAATEEEIVGYTDHSVTDFSISTDRVTFGERFYFSGTIENSGTIDADYPVQFANVIWRSVADGTEYTQGSLFTDDGGTLDSQYIRHEEYFAVGNRVIAEGVLPVGEYDVFARTRFDDKEAADRLDNNESNVTRVFIGGPNDVPNSLPILSLSNLVVSQSADPHVVTVSVHVNNTGPEAYLDALVLKVVAVPSGGGEETPISEFIVAGLAASGDASGADRVSLSKADIVLPDTLENGSHDVLVYFDNLDDFATAENEQLVAQSALTIVSDVADTSEPALPTDQVIVVTPDTIGPNVNVYANDAGYLHFIYRAEAGAHEYHGGNGHSQVDYVGTGSARENFTFIELADGSVQADSAAFGTHVLHDIDGIWFAESETFSNLADLVVGEDAVDDDTQADTETDAEPEPVDVGHTETGGDGRDVFNSQLFDVTYNGGGQYDQVNYHGPNSVPEHFTITRTATDTVVVTSDTYGLDTLIDIEGIWFDAAGLWQSLSDLAVGDTLGATEPTASTTSYAASIDTLTSNPNGWGHIVNSDEAASATSDQGALSIRSHNYYWHEAAAPVFTFEDVQAGQSASLSVTVADYVTDHDNLAGFGLTLVLLETGANGTSVDDFGALMAGARASNDEPDLASIIAGDVFEFDLTNEALSHVAEGGELGLLTTHFTDEGLVPEGPEQHIWDETRLTLGDVVLEVDEFVYG